jgi:general secretion pathway protein L
MNFPRRIASRLSDWLDSAAEGTVSFVAQYRSSRRFRFVEQSDGNFVVTLVRKRSSEQLVSESVKIADRRIVDGFRAEPPDVTPGSAIEVVLLPNRFMFRPLELPSRASDFLEGIVRAQIDRLTPWNASEAAFGWSVSREDTSGRLSVTVVATARSLIAPIVNAISDLSPDSITVTTTAETADGRTSAVNVFTRRIGDDLAVRRVRRGLVLVASAACCAAFTAVAAWAIVGADLKSQQASLARQLTENRASLESGHATATGGALSSIERRKRMAPSGVMVLDALSQILPDDTYLNEFRMEDGKIQIAGLTHDAPALIRLIEQSQHFTRTSFFAPTTRLPDETEEHFHIEAAIKPFFGNP